MDIHLIFWIVFSILFVSVFFVDMFVTDHRRGDLQVKTALFWCSIWVSTAFLFAIILYYFFPHGEVKSFEFITGYLIEYSLSVDNLFVFIMIFQTMSIPHRYQPRILKWGILGAVVLRILFIMAGVELITRFSFMIYIFGGVLVYTSYKMMTSKDEEIHPEKNIFVRFSKKLFRIKTDVNSDHFFVKHDGKRFATIAFIALVLIESTDLIFAVDSIPAVLAITRDPFVAITSNLFAILGLRSLFFALSGILKLFRYLKYGISFILLFVGIKMLLSSVLHIPVQISLLVIIATLGISIFASVIIKESDDKEKKSHRG